MLHSNSCSDVSACRPKSTAKNCAASASNGWCRRSGVLSSSRATQRHQRLMLALPSGLDQSRSLRFQVALRVSLLRLVPQSSRCRWVVHRVSTLTFLARKLEIALKELSNAGAIDRTSDTYIYSHTTAIGSDMKSGRYPTLYGSSGLH